MRWILRGQILALSAWALVGPVIGWQVERRGTSAPVAFPSLLRSVSSLWAHLPSAHMSFIGGYTHLNPVFPLEATELLFSALVRFHQTLKHLLDSPKVRLQSGYDILDCSFDEHPADESVARARWRCLD